jgi:hypothetical protein
MAGLVPAIHVFSLARLETWIPRGYSRSPGTRPGMTMHHMTEQLTPDHFRPHVDKVFRVQGTHHAFTLTRIETRRREDWEHEMGCASHSI